MKIVVVSDSHGKSEFIDEIIEWEKNIDRMIFCGDGLPDFMYLHNKITFPVTKVSGNVDRAAGSALDSEDIIEISGKQVFVTHGDNYSVKGGYDILLKRGVEIKADIILFGHTHRQYAEKVDGIFIFNPGVLNQGEYGILIIKDDSLTFQHKTLR